MCRLYSRRISTLKPEFDAAGVSLVAVGLEELGLEEFVEGKFFDGDLYVDVNKQTYKDLGYKRLGFISGISSIFGKIGRKSISDARAAGIGGNFSGDGYQNGGTLIVNTEGKVLLSYVQENPAEHVPFEDVYAALGMTKPVPPPEGAEGSKKPEVVCNDDVCQIKK